MSGHDCLLQGSVCKTRLTFGCLPPLPLLLQRDVQAAPAYAKLRVERMNQRMAGIRAKRAKEAEAAEKDN